MTSMTRPYSTEASQARSVVDETGNFSTQDAQTLTDWLPGLPHISLIPAIQRYFHFVQRTGRHQPPPHRPVGGGGKHVLGHGP